jgi:predicted signal transduction protein with EAL and GGDEF domain
MYAAKRAGKGLARTYSAELAQPAGGELDLQAALLADLSAGRIGVAYQPIYSADGSVRGFEALARWSYNGTPVRPDVFLAMARELSCINVLDETVLRAAASTAAGLDRLRVGSTSTVAPWPSPASSRGRSTSWPTPGCRPTG